MTSVITRSSVEEAAGVILRGGIALIPTDTVYGLAVHPEAPSAIERLFAIKGRPEDKKLPVLVADAADIGTLGVHINAVADRLLRSELVPGPLTLALGFSQDVTRPNWLDSRYEVAVRVPHHELLRLLLKQTGPLLVTSANLSGQKTQTNVRGVLESLLSPPDLIIDGGDLSATPSTLVNCRLVPPVIERVGAVSKQALEGFLDAG